MSPFKNWITPNTSILNHRVPNSGYCISYLNKAKHLFCRSSALESVKWWHMSKSGHISLSQQVQCHQTLDLSLTLKKIVVIALKLERKQSLIYWPFKHVVYCIEVQKKTIINLLTFQACCVYITRNVSVTKNFTTFVISGKEKLMDPRLQHSQLAILQVVKLFLVVTFLLYNQTYKNNSHT